LNLKQVFVPVFCGNLNKIFIGISDEGKSNGTNCDCLWQALTDPQYFMAMAVEVIVIIGYDRGSSQTTKYMYIKHSGNLQEL
jgi:hypothetical protein